MTRRYVVIGIVYDVTSRFIFVDVITVNVGVIVIVVVIGTGVIESICVGVVFFVVRPWLKVLECVKGGVVETDRIRLSGVSG